MRPAFTQVFASLPNFASRQVLNLEAKSEQETFLQVIGNIHLLQQGEQVGDAMKLIKQYNGAYSNIILSLKYASYCMEKQITSNYVNFSILTLLSKWVEILQQIKKKKDVRLYPAVIQSLEGGQITFQQFIAYLNFISLDLFALMKSGTQESRKKYNDQSSYPHLDINDLLQLLKAILPRVLMNIQVPRSFFPQTLIKSQDQFIDILYSNQQLENMIHTKQHYLVLIKHIFKILLPMEMEPIQAKQLIISSFNYYALFHKDKNNGASQIIIQSLKKMTSAVRFAINDQILLFLITLKKLGKELFINYITDKFNWIQDVLRGDCSAATSKELLKPFWNKAIGKSEHVRIDSGKTQTRYIQIYNRFSLLYFSLNCIEYDITIRFWHLGNFNSEKNQKKLLFIYQKRSGIFQGSIQALEPGIYMFQFDNSYSWMKGKVIGYDVTVLVPLQIKKHGVNPLIPIAFQKNSELNQVPFENVVGWIDEDQIKKNATVINVKQVNEGKVKIFNVKVTRNLGSIYEYQSQSKFRFISKIQKLNQEENIFWQIEDCRVPGIDEVKSWLEGDFQPQRFVLEKQTMQISESIQEEQNKKQQQKQENIPQKSQEEANQKQQDHKKQLQQQKKNNEQL